MQHINNYIVVMLKIGSNSDLRKTVNCLYGIVAYFTQFPWLKVFLVVVIHNTDTKQ